ncbi:Cation/H(+) antiporter 15 [Heracleum sosnowskyi]|uniref:Cation/H(+) antiporter 15 n=1 Tax=Heracleum sosnowskyi TaxID=360622 RepID=A0AAD8ND30_9APIA|nr:Cation/H(+) antiporter 15 [Heracleum sosnowskyi]KAK1403930.1 Cation/H(+) antiporter 15 [Heracleum sosnowskyi]
MDATNISELSEARQRAAGMVCYAPKMILTKGVWENENPLDYSVPLFLVQLLVVSCLGRVIHLVFKPFRQPKALSQILCGIILGPSILGRSSFIIESFFPLRSVILYDTMANIGLVFNLFLVGIEMDIFHSFRVEGRSIAIAVVSMILPFAISCCTSYILENHIPKELNNGKFIIFLALAASVSAFQLLSRVLVELKILNTEIGRIAMQSSFLNDVFSWFAVIIFLVVAKNDNMSASPVWVIICSVAFILFFIFVIRPALWLLIRRTPEGKSFSELSISLILAGVMLAGFVSEVIGVHAIFGAFIFGLVIPSGPLVQVLVERLEDIVTGILLPLYYAGFGLRAKITRSGSPYNWSIVIIISFAFLGKAIGTFLAALVYRMPLRDAATLSALMNAKGLIELVILNQGLEHEIIDSTSFSVMMFATVFTIGITIPLITIIYKPSSKLVTYRGRAIDKAKSETELRVLVVVQSSRNVPTIINLLEASNPITGLPLCVYVLHLAELTGRASAMLITHGTQDKGTAPLNTAQAQSENILQEFKKMEEQNRGMTVQPQTAISPFATMHEDICNMAEDKKVAFIIIPFHKQQTVDGEMTTTNPEIQKVNQRVLENAVCSVGILIDRGLGGISSMAGTEVAHHIAVLFFSGPDDREALAYGMRLGQHPNNNVTVIRFVPGKQAKLESEYGHLPRRSHRPTPMDTEKFLDDDYIREFKLLEAHNESLNYAEAVVNDSEETVAAVKSVDKIHDLFLVGRRQGVLSNLTEGLTEWSETPELGAIGDLLVSPDFPAKVSVLVVQHYLQ